MGCTSSNAETSIRERLDRVGREPRERDKTGADELAPDQSLSQGFLPDQQIAWIIDDAVPKVRRPKKKNKATIELQKGEEGSGTPFSE